jgi:hypothetical protein
MLLPGAEIALLTPINTLCNYNHTWTRSRSERERDRKDFENLERERISSLNAAFICVHYAF